jgi:hypothetical protein
VGHRDCHRWSRWWTRGTGSLSEDCCYSNLLDLLRVKSRVCIQHLVWDFLHNLLWWNWVNSKRERKIEKTERKQRFFSFFGTPVKKIKKIYQNDLGPGSRTMVSWWPGIRVPIEDRTHREVGSSRDPDLKVRSRSHVVYYETIKREVKTRPINVCRCDERLKTKVEEPTYLIYTGLFRELEHLKTKTRLIDEKFVSVMGEYVFLKW